MKTNTTKVLILISVLGLLFSTPLHAQVAGGTFTGTINDASGGAVGNAQVNIKNAATGVSKTFATNASGIYTASNLLPASYDITVSAPGFSTTVQSGVTLTVGAVEVLNLTLRVGRVNEQVVVTGEAPAVELASSTISATVNETTVRELPLNGRDWASLATLEPGVAVVHSQDKVTNPGGHARGLGTQMSINGTRPTQNSYRLNGLIVNDYSNAGPGNVLGQSLGVDAVQEFSVLTNNYSTEYGYTSGGVINAITKSGTNQFHGSAYEFLRNEKLDAANFFENATGTPRAPFRRNQFGGSAGGPIKKDRIWVFGDYEGLRQTKGIIQGDKTLSDNARLGILNDANGNPLPAITSCPFANSTLLDPKASVCVDNDIAKFFTFFPKSNGALIGPDNNAAQYNYSAPQIVPDNYYTARGDVKISDKDSLNASWYYDHSTWSKPGNLNQVVTGFIIGRQGGVLEETHVFGSSTVNAMRVGYSRSTVDGQIGLSAINPAAADTSRGLFPGFDAPRFANAGGGSGIPGLTRADTGLLGSGIQNYIVQNVQFYDDAARTVGTHSLKFGFMFIRYQDNVFAPFDQDGRGAFPGISEFLQNEPNFMQVSLNLGKIFPHDLRTSIFAGYFQDDWQMRPGLTLNLGLRYEMNTLPIETKGQVQNLPVLTTNPSGCSAVGSVATGCGSLNNFFFASNPSKKNFEPRVGFAWDPFRNGKTAIRGGFGIFDALILPFQLALNNAQTSPYHVAASLTAPLPQGAFPNQIVPLANAIPPAALAKSILWNYVEPNPKRNYVYQYNLGVQRQITPSLSATVSYAGSETFHNPFQEDDTNTVFPTKTSAGWLFPNPVGSGQLINPNVAQIQSTLWESKAWYNALQVGVEKRISHGIQFQASYTWSKTMDTSSGSFAGDNFASNLSPTTPWWDLSLVKGLSDLNIGQNLVFDGLWRVPTPASFAGPAGWIARGWGLGGILTLQSGVPIWPLWGIGSDPMGQRNSEPIAYPNRLCGNLVNSRSVYKTTQQYIKPECLGLPQAPSLGFYNGDASSSNIGCDKSFAYPTCVNLMGNLGRNTITGPGLIDLDFSMLKDNHIRRISETFNIQFRAEFFNILNRANFAPPIDNLDVFELAPGALTGAPGTGSAPLVGGFGTFDATSGTSTPERQIQFALKVIW